MHLLNSAQTDNTMTDVGFFQANLTSEADSTPIANARIQISDINDPTRILEEVTTDGNGQSETVSLPAPPLEYSMDPVANQPYAEYNIRITAQGYETKTINGAEILSGEIALQNSSLLPEDPPNDTSTELFVIPPHTLYGEYPPKIPESEIKDVNQTGEIVLSRVVIPSGVRNFPFQDSSNGSAVPNNLLSCSI